MSEVEAESEASERANLQILPGQRIDISEVDLAYLSLVSSDLEQRVNAHRREFMPRLVELDDVGLAEERERAWIELKAHLRQGLRGG